MKKIHLMVTFMILVLIIMLLRFLYIRHPQIFNEKEWNSIKMFEFIKQIFISTMIFVSNLSNVNPLECISIKN